MNTRLPYLLQPYNICHFKDSTFYIGNRKTYPNEKSFVECTSCKQIGDALRMMITQGGGPLQVALTAFRYIASEMDRKILPFSYNSLEKEILYIVNARVTNTTMKRCVYSVLDILRNRFIDPTFNTTDLIIEINKIIDDKESEFNEIYFNMGKLGSSLIKDNDTILTTCFAEHSFILSVYFAKESGKKVSVLVNETRPYFQGTRLTAPSLHELKIDVKIISDAMGSFFMQKNMISHYMSAADLVCMDGTVVNKIGTNQNAICAKYYNIPYTAFAMSPDPSKNTSEDIQMEYRDGSEILKYNDEYIGDKTITALYPAFDVVDNSLVTNIVTNKGIFKTNEIRGVFK
ncbi:MAG: translation initiation factor 2 [Sphaerochaetaceae bacterium]|nr:translation initiation factor 2 [Sphaerochaetaceae bacterium]MDC7238386.1 translation initiation factor 2 [Sphaerochaetaceae bacterium]